MDALTRNMERLRGASFTSDESSSAHSGTNNRLSLTATSMSMSSQPSYELEPLDEERPPPRKAIVYDSSDVPDSLPEEYKKNRENTEPILYYLQKCPEDASLARLLKAAEDDVRLHQARIKAVIENNPKLVASYQLKDDPALKERQLRKEQRLERLLNLHKNAPTILKELEEEKKGLTTEERIQVKLARWQRALDLYVYSPAHMQTDMLGLLEKLIEGLSEEEELSEIFSQASKMCLAVQEATLQDVRDASDAAAEAEDAYQIRLEAHALHARHVMMDSDDIQSQFRINGRAALQIGQQLEFAESKRRQCESASILIRRWWMMENLAEQESMSGEEIKVQEEMRGVIPGQKCRMDPLFVNPERSLEAARALKQLRAVVKARGNAAATAVATGGGWSDSSATRRFEITAKLVARTSLSLEQRLLNSFSEVYSQGGIYDFSEDPRPGHIDWVQLKDLAQALLLFDSGRNLHRRYVEMVISTRFPELFKRTHAENEDDDGNFNMKATRTKLSSLFHRVSDVCTAEFELIAHVFGAAEEANMPLTVARALLQRVISDPKNGLQARINDLLDSVDRRGDFDAGAKKLDTFVVIHEKAAGLFSLLKEAAEKYLVQEETEERSDEETSSAHSINSLKQFLTSQEIALSSSHRRGYLNLELRLLHHDCCATLSAINLTLVKPPPPRLDPREEKDILKEYRAPILPLDKPTLKRELGLVGILSGPLKSSTLRQPLIYATDSLARARLMYGVGKKGGESTAHVIISIYSQMCAFYGQAFLYPVVESLGELLERNAPSTPPALPFDESSPAHDLGVDPAFWVGLERVHSASKAFDRELWAENRTGSARVWEILVATQAVDSMPVARRCREKFFSELERRGETSIMRALDSLCAHIHWVLVTGGESMSATGGSRIRHQITGAYSGPYAIAPGSSLEAPNSPAVKSLTYCLRSQFVNVQAALTSESLSSFWTALSMRLYDILVTRLLQHYFVSTVGAVILSRDVEALRSVSMLAGSDHTHWDNLRELVTLYMTPPDALKTMLVGPEGDVNSSKGLFKRVGRLQSLVFMSRRVDYRYKTVQGEKKSGWAVELLEEFGVQDPTDHGVAIAMFAAGRKQ